MRIIGRLRAVVGAIPRFTVRREAAAYLRTAGDCRNAQAATLRRLLALNADSKFAVEYGLDRVGDVREFRTRLPVSDYTAFRDAIEQVKQGRPRAFLGSRNPLLMFALSSGTTADTKYIPITQTFLDDYRRGWQIWGIHTLDAHPALNSRKILQISSCHDRIRTAGGTPCGSISGLVSTMQKRIVRTMYSTPGLVASIADPQARYYTTLRLAIADPDIGMVTTANPSTLIHLAKLAERRCQDIIRDIADGTLAVEQDLEPSIRRELEGWIRRRNFSRARWLTQLVQRTGAFLPRDYWPELKVAAVWTGGSAGAYLPALRGYYGEVAIRDHGLSASEGRMTIPLRDLRADGILDVHSHFFEFIPEAEYGSDSPVVLEAHELEQDRNYYILLTTSSGLCRYDICDVVRCTGFYGTTPLLEFMHKGAHISNLTGEKLSESQVVCAVREAAQSCHAVLEQFTVSPVWGDPPRYQLFTEAQCPADDALGMRLAPLVEAKLQELNCEYREKRATGRLGPLAWRPLAPGAFQRLTSDRQKRSGGSHEQYKHPCLIPDLQFTRQYALSAEPEVFGHPAAAQSSDAPRSRSA